MTAHSQVRVLKVTAAGERRGPAVAARELYEELTPPGAQASNQDGEAAKEHSPQRDPGAGRPTKRERRAIDRLLRET